MTLLRVYAGSDIGKVRSHNEDNFLIGPRNTFIVADGTGGLLVVECGGDENEVLDLPQFKLLRNQKYGHTTQINIYEMVAIE